MPTPRKAWARCRSSEGMRTMREDGILKVLAGETTLNELARTVA
jgi:type II secretory ATPase GspE/PulE/Tfp pilus assembly ATPase PilB-like protein